MNGAVPSLLSRSPGSVEARLEVLGAGAFSVMTRLGAGSP
jgi:hypothetical protein